MPRFHIDHDIAKAKTLATEFYTDPACFDEARKKIFAACWHYVGDTDQVREKGWVTPVTLLEQYLDEPIMLSRDQDDTLHCLSNVCTHRGNLLVEQPCQLHDIRCKYHGRRFKLNGRFASMPEFKGVEDFPSEADHLTNLPIAQFGKWLFTSLQPVAPAPSFFDFMKNRIGWMPFDEFHFRPELSRDYLVDANWALYCENYLEGFHIPFVHAGLNSVIDYSNYQIELDRYSSLQLGVAKEGEMVFDLPKESPDFGKAVGGYYFFIFPNLMFNFYPWGLSINIVSPLSPGRCKVSFLSYVWNESKLRQGAGADLHKVELEDEDIVQNVQRGIRSRFYQHGRYSVTREQGTHHFHRLLAEFMNQ